MDIINYKPIGVIKSPFKKSDLIPRQAIAAPNVFGRVQIYDEYAEGLMDLDGFSHIVLVYHLHLANFVELDSYPPWDSSKRGIFSTCSPYRPNPIGISVVRLDKLEGTTLYISCIDMVDDTPVLDIKPYIPSLNPSQKVSLGWLTENIEQMKMGKSEILRVNSHDQ